MYKHETFPRAPVTEALIDLRAGPGDEKTLDQLESLTQKLSPRFPIKENRFEIQYQLTVKKEGTGAESEAKSKQIGYVMFSESRDRAVQVRLNGFAFSKMRPYESWENLRDEARDLWIAYQNEVTPRKIDRLSVRFINRIELPLPISAFQDYILTGPQIAPTLPQGPNEFFFRIVVPNPAYDRMAATITSTIERPEQDGRVLPYIFDIDAFASVDLDPSSDVIWSAFEKLREYKNTIFFLSITEKARELFR